MNVKNMMEEKFFNLFDKLPLSEAERQAAEDYLSGKAGHEVLDQFEFEDLSTIPADPAIRFFRELTKAKDHGTAAKLFSVLLAKGDATCYRMIPMEVINPEKGAVDLEVDSAKKAAAYAAILGADLYPLGSYARDQLVTVACGKTEILKQALDFEKNKSQNGKLVLYAIYFYKKYKCGDEKETAVAAEDIPMLAQYEELAVECFDALFPSSNPAVPEIKEAVRKGNVTGHILELAAAKRGVSTQTLRLLSGLAYLNYPLSEKLKDVVKICLAAEMEEALEAMNVIALVTPMDLYTRGGAYDKEFDLPSEKYIAWTAKKRHTIVLEKQSDSNFAAYIKAMDDAPLEVANEMLALIREKRPALYKALLEKNKKYGYNKKMEQLLDKLVHKDADSELIKSYLRGEIAVDKLYPFADALGKNYYYGGGQEIRILAGYDKNLLDPVFYRRFRTYMWLRRGMWFLRNDVMEEADFSRGRSPKVSEEKLRQLFSGFAQEGLSVARQLSGVQVLEENLYVSVREEFRIPILDIFSGYLKEKREETVAAFARSDAPGRLLGLEVLAKDAGQNKKEILAYVEDSAKQVKQALLAILCAQKDWAEEMKGLLASKKAAVRELAIRVFAAWQESGADYHELLTQTFEKEKNAKVKDLLADVLGAEGGAAPGGKSLSQKELVKEIHKGGKKRGLAWAYATPFSVVHTVAGETAEEEYLQAILLCYSSMEKCGCSKNAEFLAKTLHKGEFAIYVNELFDKWFEAGAEAKKRWVLYASAIHGGSEIIAKLMKQLKEWPKEGRGAIACEAVRAMSLSPLPEGLLTVDGIARKFKYRQVRTAANEALEFAAEQLGISRKELEDRIIPDFGFDEELGRTFDYGERKFRVMITAALEVEVFEEIAGDKAPAAKGKDAKAAAGTETETQAKPIKKHILGKKLKNLPAPGKKDDEKKAAAAYEEFKQMKKQMKTVVGSQKLRLEQALSSARLWSVKAWKQLFVKNPIMHQFAIGLIWGVYEDGKLLQSFRYMEDGSFNTQDEEEYFLPEETAGSEREDAAQENGGVGSGKEDAVQENGGAGSGKEDTAKENESTGSKAEKQGFSGNKKIGLVHPIELTGEDLEAWRQQLEDYEIAQPFAQLERPIFTVAEGELTQRKFSRFYGRTVNDMSLGGKLLGFGRYRGPVLDGGCVETFYREDEEIGMGAELHFSGCFAGYLNEDVTVYSVRFYKIGEVESGCCVYEKDEKKACLLRDVPAKYFSEVAMQVEKATASAQTAED